MAFAAMAYAKPNLPPYPGYLLPHFRPYTSYPGPYYIPAYTSTLSLAYSPSVVLHSNDPCAFHTDHRKIVNPSDPTCKSFLTCTSGVSYSTPTTCPQGTKFRADIQGRISIAFLHPKVQSTISWTFLVISELIFDL